MKERNFYSFLTRSRLIGLLVSIMLLIAISFAFLLSRGQPTPFLLLRGQPTPHLSPVPDPAPANSVLSIEQSILDNIKANGYNNNSSTNDGLGGLWVNWKYGSSPLQTNFNGSGSPDGDSVDPTRHDPYTDLRYLHNLWLYQSQNPNDTRYKSEIEKYTAIIKAEFNQSRDERGWLFDEEFMDLYNLSHDSFYKDTAISLVESYAQKFDPKVGSIYKTNDAHPLGSFRVDLVLESGCALIEAGTLFHNPEWLQKGQSIVNFVYTHTYIPQYHTFPGQVDRIHLEDGSVNPSEVFFSDQTNQSYTVSGNQISMGSISQIILSLLHTYQVTQNQAFLQKATDLLDQLSLPHNSLSLWDTHSMGYFSGVSFTGTGPTSPGEMQLKSHKKEAGRQMTMLQVFHLANTFTNNKYQTMEALMRQVAVSKAYYAPGHGVLYEVKPDWTPLTVNGQPEDWVTTEAMGIELEGLFTIDPRTSLSALAS
jgi:hypothetical protein